jgi:hypothetical protein
VFRIFLVMVTVLTRPWDLVDANHVFHHITPPHTGGLSFHTLADIPAMVVLFIEFWCRSSAPRFPFLAILDPPGLPCCSLLAGCGRLLMASTTPQPLVISYTVAGWRLNHLSAAAHQIHCGKLPAQPLVLDCASRFVVSAHGSGCPHAVLSRVSYGWQALQLVTHLPLQQSDFSFGRSWGVSFNRFVPTVLAFARLLQQFIQSSFGRQALCFNGPCNCSVTFVQVFTAVHLKAWSFNIHGRTTTTAPD